MAETIEPLWMVLSAWVQKRPWYLYSVLSFLCLKPLPRRSLLRIVQACPLSTACARSPDITLRLEQYTNRDYKGTASIRSRRCSSLLVARLQRLRKNAICAVAQLTLHLRATLFEQSVGNRAAAKYIIPLCCKACACPGYRCAIGACLDRTNVHAWTYTFSTHTTLTNWCIQRKLLLLIIHTILPQVSYSGLQS